MKIWTKIEWAIIVAASVLLLLLLILFAYNHPHSDDFSYNYFIQHKSFWEAQKYLFANNTGRFLSTSLIFLSPLKQHSIAGYQWLTAGLFLGFCLSLFLCLYIILSGYVKGKSIVFLFAFLFLGFCSFIPNLQEFIYWLSSSATYMTATSFWLWSIVFHFLLAQPKHQRKWWLWMLCGLNTIAICGCSEAGILLNSIPLLLHFLYPRPNNKSHHKGIWIILAIYLLASYLTGTAPGNINRHRQTPFSGNLLLAFSGGFYAAGFWLSKWALIFMPLVCFYILIFGHRLKNWSTQISHFKIFRAKTIFIGSLIFFLLCQIIVVWMSGSTPEARFENVLFLFLLISFLFASQLMMQEQAEFFDMLKGKLHRGFKTLSFIYLLCIFIVIPNHAMNAMLDVVSGNAGKYNQENIRRYSLIAKSDANIIGVPNIKFRPKIIYYPTLSCSSSIDTNDIPRRALADYFGKKWIYEYPCRAEIPEYSIKELLKQKRQQFFSKKKT